MERILISIFTILICGTSTSTALVGCYGSYSVGPDDDSGTDPMEYDGGDDGIDKPNTDDRNDPIEYDGGDDGIDKPDVDGGNRGNDPIEYDGGDDGIDKPDVDSNNSEIDISKEIESDVVQLSESEWTGSTFSDRYDRRWFKVDVTVGNVYHIYIDDEFGSGLHYADEEIYVYEGEPSDLNEYFDYVDVYYGDDLIGFFEKPYEYKANFTGELYILLESDNPGYQTFEIRYEVIPHSVLL